MQKSTKQKKEASLLDMPELYNREYPGYCPARVSTSYPLVLHHLSNAMSSCFNITAAATHAARPSAPTVNRQHFFTFFIIIFPSIFFL